MQNFTLKKLAMSLLSLFVSAAIVGDEPKRPAKEIDKASGGE